MIFPIRCAATCYQWWCGLRLGGWLTEEYRHVGRPLHMLGVVLKEPNDIELWFAGRTSEGRMQEEWKFTPLTRWAESRP